MSTDDVRVTNYDAEAITDEEILLAQEPQVLELSDRDMDALLAAIANPPPPNAAMLHSIARWRERMRHE